ncbi:MAG: folate family ECF transporter S component [Lawsonibacter sp.]|jgi:ECF transporter S component (folate family)|nr:folate family ECF transporter S component [Lawsonibacter sp.]MCI9028288.1 folate family ECF transporter S component [Lawsonibacter sp.]MCI9295381.1 folate family ECF transporter S component [Lawsonibacter sp.]MCI9655334.1 folate family ECF transporter S component [Lawsonibacter sp.]MDE6897657.1 folate family ECF transporter S component [Lawsonibacter sp.]
MFVKKFDVKLMCQLALLVALYYLLSITLVIHTGNFKLTFISLPVIAAALLYGPGAGFTVALLGEFLAQMSGPFGLAPNTVLWLIPPAVNGLLVGLAAFVMWRKGRPLERRPVACYAACIVCAVLTSGVNTLVLWADSLLYGYYNFAFIFGSALLRLGKDLIVAAIVTTIAIPLVHALRRSGLVAPAGNFDRQAQ